MEARDVDRRGASHEISQHSLAVIECFQKCGLETYITGPIVPAVGMTARRLGAREIERGRGVDTVKLHAQTIEQEQLSSRLCGR